MFSRLKIGARLISGFMIIALLVALVSVIAIVQLYRLQEPLTKDIPAGLSQIEQTSRLDHLSNRIRYYDQILTDAARNYIRTKKSGWRKLYKRFDDKLNSAVSQAVQEGDESDKQIFLKVQAAKDQFQEVERQAINTADRGYWAEAWAMLEHEDYWQAKNSYREGIQDYVKSRGKKHGQSLEVTATNVDKIVKRTLSLLQSSLRMLIVISIFGFVLAVILGLLVSASIVNPIHTLQKGARLIGKGILDYRIKTSSKDEIAQLGQAFNEMGEKLKESYEGLEGKVKEKTKELSQKVDEIQLVMKDLEAAKTNIEQEKVGYEALFSSIGEGMVATDKQGRLVIMNHQAETLLDIKAIDATGQPLSDLVRYVDEKDNLIEASKNPINLALETGRKTVTTAFYEPKASKKFPVAITVSPVILSGKTIGAIQIFRDITKEKQVDRMKSEFISTVSHELRTPMTVIREGIALVRENMLGETTPDQREVLNLALESIDRLRRIIDNLLDISKIEAGRLEIKMDVVDIASVVQQIHKTFAQRCKELNIELRMSVAQETLNIHADRDKIIQVFVNIIGNAMKFTEKGHIEIKAVDTEKEVLCSIRDTGPGISKENLAKLFGKFQQLDSTSFTGEKGTGLGLSIAKGIVELHKGKIWVESELGKGTTFFIKLPKFKTFELLREYVVQNVQEASRYGTIFSVMHIRLLDSEALSQSIGREKMAAVITKMEHLIKKAVRKQVDTTIKDASSLFMILPTAGKTDAQNIYERMQPFLEDYLIKQEIQGKVRLSSQIASFPEDGNGIEDILKLIA